MADKNIVLQGHPFANERVAGNFASVANFDPFLNFDKRANLHVIPNFTTIEIGEAVKPDIFAQFYIGGNSSETGLCDEFISWRYLLPPSPKRMKSRA